MGKVEKPRSRACQPVPFVAGWMLSDMYEDRIPELFYGGCTEEMAFPQAASITELPAPQDVPCFFDRLKYKLSPNWRANGEPIHLGVEMEKGGIRWPDFIKKSAVSRKWRLLVSERVIATLEKEGYHAFDAKPAILGKVSGKKLQATPPPRYFGLRPIHGLEMETRTYRYEDGELRYLGSYGDPAENLELSNWQTGLCRKRRVAAGTSLKPRLFAANASPFMCTRQFVEIAFRESWTNLEFRAVDALESEGIKVPYVQNVDVATGSIEGPWYTELQAKAR